jgi:hypothetical protein
MDASAIGRSVRQFERDWANTALVELTLEVCEAADELSAVTGARSFGALHLGAAKVVGGGALPIVRFDDLIPWMAGAGGLRVWHSDLHGPIIRP